MKPEPTIEVDGKETDATFHDFVMAGVVEDHAYRLTAYRAAIRVGVEEAVARKVYLKSEDSEEGQ